MKKIILLGIVGILVLQSFGALATSVKKQPSSQEECLAEHFTIDQDLLQYSEKGGYLEVSFDDCLYLMNPGQPMIPRLMKSFELPFGATNIQVETTVSAPETILISHQIRPSPTPLPQSTDQQFITNAQKDLAIYSSNNLYPHEPFSVHIGVGLNREGERVTHCTVNVFPIRYQPASNKVYLTEDVTISVTYDELDITNKPLGDTYELLIITPTTFSSEVDRLKEHKEAMGMTTMVKTTEDIFSEYEGVDKPEEIKLFIKDAIEEHDITYVLLFGGLKNILWGRQKDNTNGGTLGWYVPVRFSNFQYDGAESYNFTSGEPTYISDLYYMDIYKEGGEFEDWDSNGNGVFAEWSGDDLRDESDLYPDVCVGRLAVRNMKEARDVINKIIAYESQPADPSWFNRMISISGDGFLDQEDWNIQWDTSSLPDGEYTIYAQATNPEAESGPIDEIHITLDKTAETNLTINHDDNVKEELQNGYPAPPIAEIMTVSNGNTLGNTDYEYQPNDGEAYCNDLYWYANISYIDEVLIIRGKAYDPKPYGNLTDLELWIEDDTETVVFSASRENMETYYEGEWVVGEKLLRGRGGAQVYMPPEFDCESVFTSNGRWFDQSDVIDEFSEGYGLAYFSGHGSPGWWGDHYPGIPGNRRYGQVAGLVVTQISPYFPFFYFPVLPMRKLANTDQLPVVCVGGCHNSMFGISLIPSILNRFIQNWMFTYGTPTPECWGWYMVKLPQTGAIATMGNTGYGWGSEGDVCTIGTGDAWINTEFFRQYGEEGQEHLGMAYSQSISTYIDHHMTFELEYWRHDYGWDGIDQKTVEQWVLLGDPSLLIGGYD